MKRAEIERLLPSIIQRTVQPQSPLAAVLDIMETLHLPSETALARLDAAFDPRRTTEDVVPFLARWVDLDWLFQETRSTGTITRSRPTISSAAYLSRWRGTAKGLHHFLQRATGEENFEIKENVDRDGTPKLFHLVVVAPGSMRPHQALIERIVESEKPAYVTYELVIKAET
jgi:phage tail-like protein